VTPFNLGEKKKNNKLENVNFFLCRFHFNKQKSRKENVKLGKSSCWNGMNGERAQEKKSENVNKNFNPSF
jgi:hypothetical protein